MARTSVVPPPIPFLFLLTWFVERVESRRNLSCFGRTSRVGLSLMPMASLEEARMNKIS